MSNTATLTEHFISGAEELKAIDRCDQGNCGAAAISVVTLADGGQLVFCGHHTDALPKDLLATAKIDRAVRE